MLIGSSTEYYLDPFWSNTCYLLKMAFVSVSPEGIWFWIELFHTWGKTFDRRFQITIWNHRKTHIWSSKRKTPYLTILSSLSVTDSGLLRLTYFFCFSTEPFPLYWLIIIIMGILFLMVLITGAFLYRYIEL